MNYKKDFERTKYELDETIASLENYKKRISEQDVKIIDMEVLKIEISDNFIIYLTSFI